MYILHRMRKVCSCRRGVTEWRTYHVHLLRRGDGEGGAHVGTGGVVVGHEEAAGHQHHLQQQAHTSARLANRCDVTPLHWLEPCPRLLLLGVDSPPSPQLVSRSAPSCCQYLAASSRQTCQPSARSSPPSLKQSAKLETVRQAWNSRQSLKRWAKPETVGQA